MTTRRSVEEAVEDMDRNEEDDRKIEFVDRRRIKSPDDTVDSLEEANLERIPTYVERIQTKMDEKDSQLKEYISAHKEKMAEMDKVRKRLEEDVEHRSLNRFGEMMGSLLPVLDDLDRAIEAASRDDAQNPMLDGVAMVRSSLLEVLTGQGLEVIDCVGKRFDPELARALSTTPVDDEAEDNVVLEQLVPGYRFGSRVLRHALVRVGQKR